MRGSDLSIAENRVTTKNRRRRGVVARTMFAMPFQERKRLKMLAIVCFTFLKKPLFGTIARFHQTLMNLPCTIVRFRQTL